MVDEKWSVMKEIMKKPNQALVIIESMLFNGFFATAVLWFPYFFSVMGYESYANSIGLTVPITAIIAPTIFEILIKPCE